MTTIAVPTAPHLPTTPTARRVFVANVRAEWTKLRSVRSTTWALLATVGIAVGFGALVGVSQMSGWDDLDRAEQLRFDPTFFSLSGLWLAQLAVGVLGVLLVTSEYATGQIRATFGATPQRRTVLAAKATAFTGVVIAAGLVSSFVVFFVGQAIFATKGLGVSISDPDVFHAVAGGALYLAAVGLLGLGLGTILRRTAGAVAAWSACSSSRHWSAGSCPPPFWSRSAGSSRPRPAWPSSASPPTPAASPRGPATACSSPTSPRPSSWAASSSHDATPEATTLDHDVTTSSGDQARNETATRPARKPPAWFVHTAWRIHRMIYRITGGRFLWTPANKRGWGAMLLTTMGRRSGRERNVIIGYIEDGPNLVAIAMNGWDEGHPAWWLNLQTNPRASVRLAQQDPRPVHAREATGAERDRLWRRWVDTDPELTAPASQRTTETPVVVLEPA